MSTIEWREKQQIPNLEVFLKSLPDLIELEKKRLSNPADSPAERATIGVRDFAAHTIKPADLWFQSGKWTELDVRNALAEFNRLTGLNVPWEQIHPAPRPEMTRIEKMRGLTQ